jgi:16S rRNA (guanine(966)-N(2))-methyltransferase RsmD
MGVKWMRVIAGRAKSKTLKRVPGKGTRPITDRVKESLFNILGRKIDECRFLDLFAGTGAVGIEALSRGASEAVFVEKAPKAIKVVRENLRLTGMTNCARVFQEDVFKFIPKTYEQFHIIYIAPPQFRDIWAKTLMLLDRHSISDPDGIIVAQIFPKEFEPLPLNQYILTDQRQYGSTMLCFYEMTSD